MHKMNHYAMTAVALLAAAWATPAMLHAQTVQPIGASSPGAALSHAAGNTGAAPQAAAPAAPPAAPAPAPAPAQIPAPAATPPQAPASPFAGPAPTNLPPAAASTAAPPPVRGLPSGSPSLAIAGGTYSADPAQRFLIVNGQMVREGADLGGGIQLSAIRPDSAVLTVQGRTVVVFF